MFFTNRAPKQMKKKVISMQTEGNLIPNANKYS